MSRDHEYHALRLAKVVDETADARSFVFEVPAELAESFAYKAGQFCTFHAEIGGEEVVRCYSMSSSPDADESLTVTVKRVPDGKMSNWMNDTLAPGDSLEVMPPAGLFVMRESDAPIVAFAGGSGITPILSIVKSALATTARPIRLIYANRDAKSVIFAEVLERLQASSEGRLSVHHHLDGDEGFLDAAACAALVGDSVEADFYVCGPGPYMAVVEEGLAERGVDPSRVFLERFELPEEDEAGATTAPASPGESVTESIVVTLEGRKQTIGYDSGDTILQSMRRAGMSPPFSCLKGNCASCMAFVEAGSAKMRMNNALDADEVEEGWVLTCQAVPTTRELVIDFDR